VISFAFFRGLSKFSVSVELQNGFFGSFLNNNWYFFFFIFILGVALENGSWKFLSIIDAEAATWDGGALAPNAVSIGIAFSFFVVGSSAFIGIFNTNSDVAVKFVDGLLRSFLDEFSIFLNWSLNLLIAGKDSSWELLGIVNRETTTWDG